MTDRRTSSLAWLVCGGLLCLACVSGCGHSVASPPGSGREGGERKSASRVAAEPAGGASESSVSVQTVKPQRRDLISKFDQPGIVEASASADLFSRVSGYVKTVNVDIGDQVEAGQMLLEVDVPELEQELAFKEALVAQAEAELSQSNTLVTVAQGAIDTHPSQVDLAVADTKKAEADRNSRKREYERYAALAADNASTRQLADEKEFAYLSSRSAYDSAVAKHRAVQMDLTVLKAKLAGANADVKTKQAKVAVASADREKTRVLTEYAKLKAPYAGVITRRNVDPGEYVHSPSSDKATPPFTIARTQTVTVVMRVPEKEVSHVRIGNLVSMDFEALGKEAVTGKVTRLAKSLEDKSRTMRVEIDVENPEGKLYPGMFGSVALTLSDIKDALTVPASALYGTGEELFVVTTTNNLAHRVRVRTGYDNGRIVQIVSGLSGDEQVVVSNKGQLADGQPVDPHRVDKTEANDSVLHR